MFSDRLAVYTAILFAAGLLGCAPALDPIGDRAVEEGGTLSVGVRATSPDGTIPSLDGANLPPGAVFTDHGDGTGSLVFAAPTGPSLVFENVTFTASTPQGTDSESIHVFVDDTDAGGWRVRFDCQGKTGQHGIALDAAGVLYLADFQNTVWKVSGGTSSVYALLLGGTPSGLLFDAAGDLYVSATNGPGIYRVKPDLGKTLFAAVPNPWQLDLDSAGNLYAASHGGDIYRVTPGGGVSVFSPGFTLPFGVAVDSADHVFITEHTLGNIYRINPSGVPTLFASGLTNPEGIVLDDGDHLFVADTADGLILRFDPLGSQSLVARGMSFPVSMAFGPDGNLYLACAGSSGRVYVLTRNP